MTRTAEVDGPRAVPETPCDHVASVRHAATTLIARHRLTTPVNALTVDVEDWVQSVLDPTRPLSDRFVKNTRRVLDLLHRYETRATFFILGLAAEKAPELVREIHRSGHEVQSHGYGHRPISTQTPREFRRDLERSRKGLEDLIGEAVDGYRAPAFSITRPTLWALDVLVEMGFVFDSSIHPARTRRYGIAGAPRHPHRLRTPGGGELIEVPVASWRALGWTVPMGGGGYFRLFPYALIAAAVRQLHRAGLPATVYCHPYEFSPEELESFGRNIPLRVRVHQGLGRRGFTRKIERLLAGARFGTVGEVLQSAGKLPLYEHLCDAARDPGAGGIRVVRW